ncbi:MAG: MarR family transcriptional regulator [Micropepsaceae bacterium]
MKNNARRMAMSKEASDASSRRFLCFALQRVTLAISRQLDSELRPIGLTSRQSIILSAIAETGPLHIAALADMLGKDRTTITANLRPLMERGLIASALDHDDRRTRRIALTQRGIRLLEQARGPLSRFNAELCARIQSRDALKDPRAVLESLSQQLCHE